MLLIIHNLPLNTRYTDVKEMIKDKCGLTEMIIDNLVTEGKSKKVTVGLADEGDAAILVRKINGLYVCNQQLYVEDVRQKKNTEQPYRPGPMSKQHDQEQFNQVPGPQFDNQYYGQQAEMQFQPPPFMPMESQLPPGPPQPNFGVPFYMTAQNQNVGNNHQFMVQYPKVQGPMVNEPYEGRDTGFDQQYGGRQRDQSVSTDRVPFRRPSPKRSSRWNEPDVNRSDNRRGRDRSDQRDDRHDADSYRGNQDSFNSRSNQDYGSNKPSNRFEKPFNQSNETKWERPDRSTFREQNEPYRSNVNKNFNAQDRRFNQEGQSQRFRENGNSQSRGFGYESRQSDFSKKRPYESGINKFGPPNKKFASNKQRNFNQQGASGSQFSKNNQNKNNSYSTKSQARGPMQQNKPYMQSKGPQKAKAPWKPNNQNQANQKLTPEMIARHEAWRVQASSCIATEILKNMGKPCNKRDQLVIALKACVRARIDVVVGDNMSITLRDMLSNYRDKFQDDDAFYKTVCEKVARGELDDLGTGKKESDDVAAKKKQEETTKAILQFVGKPPATAPSSGSTDRLPKYPAGDKKVFRQLKQAQKEEMINDDLYNLDPEHEKALKEEFDKIEELIKQQYENPENETEKAISKFMDDVFVPDLRKILSLHVKKRVLDVRTNLMVRLICRYKAPKRDVLDAFLKDYGVISLKASEKNRNMIVAYCDSYENFDALCKLESAVINDLKVSFKPLHITGPPLKGKFKKQVNLAKKTATERYNQPIDIATVNKNESTNDNGEVNDGNEGMASEENDDKPTIDDQENQGNENSECEIISSNKSEDVIIVEDNSKSKDVIVIDDHDEKVTADDEQVIDFDEASTTDADSKVAIDNEEPTMNKESVTVDDNEPAVTDGNEIMEQDVPEIIDADKIADDDLEDF